MRNDKSQVIGLARKLAGKTEDGSAPVNKVDGERELVTQVTPILMSRPLWSSVPAQVQWTDALQGVEVNDLIIVQSRGVGHRVGIALVTPKSLSDKFESEQVGTVNGKPLEVGGSVSLSSSDVGALPNTATYSDVDALPDTATYSDVDAASETHRHTVSMPAFNPGSWGRGTYIGAAPAAYDPAYLNQLRNQINDITAALSTVENWVYTAAQYERTTSTPTS